MIKAFKPLADRVLVERFAAETKTKGGIMIPDKAQGKVLEATVIATGPGGRNSKGDLIPMSVQVHDHAFVPSFLVVVMPFLRKLVDGAILRFVTCNPGQNTQRSQSI